MAHANHQATSHYNYVIVAKCEFALVKYPMCTSLHILYLGQSGGTSLDRANALRRLGHKINLIDPHAFLPHRGIAGRIVAKLIYEFGGNVFESYIWNKIHKILKGKKFDIIWINSGELFGPATIRSLKAIAPCILNYNNDDPFGIYGTTRFSLYRRAIPEYDMLVVMRASNVNEAIELNARKTYRALFAADEVNHKPLVLTNQDRIKWTNSVIFVGTWMPERGHFMRRLVELGIPLKIYGARWQKAPEWASLKAVWGGPELIGSDYVKAIQCAKVCLGMLSKGNRDLHTTRSAEIPYIGSVLCAERTIEHELLYVENQEAVFWDSPEECADKCSWLLNEPDLRKRIAKAGRQRCIKNGMLNEVVAKKILNIIISRL